MPGSDLDKPRTPPISSVERRALRHTLRTPLNGVIGYAELLLEELDDHDLDEVRSDAAVILRHGRALLVTVDDLLAQGAERGEEVERRAASKRLAFDLRPVLELSQRWLRDPDVGAIPEVAGCLGRVRAAALQLDWLVTQLLSLEAVAVERAPESSEQVPLPDADLQADRARILVVDDTALNRELLQWRIGRMGHEVEVAVDGKHALDRMDAEVWDLVLLDIQMPKVDGYGVLKQMKADPALRGVPVLVLSSGDDIDAAVRCIEMGAEDYLPKPFNPVLLEARVGACLEKKKLRDREQEHLLRIQEEVQRGDNLLHALVPKEVVSELKATSTVRPQRHEDVVVLFADIVGFTTWCEGRNPEEVVPGLQVLVTHLEGLCDAHGLLKIKTIGDAFMATSGLLLQHERPALAAVRCAQAMISAASDLTPGWQLRIGLHIGPVVAGVVGKRQYQFDLWGDTVNIAARVEAAGVPGALTVTQETWDRVQDRCEGRALGEVAIKGRAPVQLIRVDRVQPDV